MVMAMVKRQGQMASHFCEHNILCHVSVTSHDICYEPAHIAAETSMYAEPKFL